MLIGPSSQQSPSVQMVLSATADPVNVLKISRRAPILSRNQSVTYGMSFQDNRRPTRGKISMIQSGQIVYVSPGAKRILAEGRHVRSRNRLRRPTFDQMRILIQRKVGSRSVVVVLVQKEQLAQVPLAEDDDMVQAFPAERANQPFRMAVLPGGSEGQSAGPECPWPEAGG
jgi:hypothetical protein